MKTLESMHTRGYTNTVEIIFENRKFEEEWLLYRTFRMAMHE
jgi:hypothetical protein